MLEFSMLAGPTIRLALGGKWTAAVPVLQWLSLTLIPPLFVAPFGSLAMALGKPDAVLRQTITEAVNKLPLVIGGAALYGVSGVVTARAVSALVSALIVLFFVRQLIGTSVLRQIGDAWRVAASGAVLVVVLLVMRPIVTDQSGLALGALLAAVSGMGLAAYASALALLWHVSGRPSGFEHSAAELAHKLLQRSRFTFGGSET
jgi:PST family polysaccharide transporter